MSKEFIKKHESYIAYVVTPLEEGYITLEYVPGRGFIFTTQNINEAYTFDKKENLIYTLEEELFEYNEIYFFIKEETRITRYVEVE